MKVGQSASPCNRLLIVELADKLGANARLAAIGCHRVQKMVDPE
jgi:hypothetical protein